MIELANINHSGAYTHEQNAFLLVLGVKLGDRHVHGGFADGVQWGKLMLEVIGKLQVSKASGDSHDFLFLASEDKGNEEVK